MSSTFLQLEILILDHIKGQHINNVLDSLMMLPQLQSLTINTMDCIQNSTLFYIRVFQLSKLKYCKVQFQSEDDIQLPKSNDVFSSIECLIIISSFCYHSFHNLLSYLYKLRHISINYLNGYNLKNIEFYPKRASSKFCRR